MTTRIATLTGAALLMATTIVAAPASAQQNCAQRDQILDRLTSKYGESRQSIGLAPNSGVASGRTGDAVAFDALPRWLFQRATQ